MKLPPPSTQDNSSDLLRETSAFRPGRMSEITNRHTRKQNEKILPLDMILALLGWSDHSKDRYTEAEARREFLLIKKALKNHEPLVTRMEQTKEVEIIDHKGHTKLSRDTNVKYSKGREQHEKNTNGYVNRIFNRLYFLPLTCCHFILKYYEHRKNNRANRELRKWEPGEEL